MLCSSHCRLSLSYVSVTVVMVNKLAAKALVFINFTDPVLMPIISLFISQSQTMFRTIRSDFFFIEDMFRISRDYHDYLCFCSPGNSSIRSHANHCLCSRQVPLPGSRNIGYDFKNRNFKHPFYLSFFHLIKFDLIKKITSTQIIPRDFML